MSSRLKKVLAKLCRPILPILFLFVGHPVVGIAKSIIPSVEGTATTEPLLTAMLGRCALLK